MRQVDVRVINPALRRRANALPIEQSNLLQRVTSFSLVCAFWGVILFVALGALH